MANIIQFPTMKRMQQIQRDRLNVLYSLDTVPVNTIHIITRGAK